MLRLECKAVDRIEKPIDLGCHWSLFELISVVCFTHTWFSCDCIECFLNNCLIIKKTISVS